MDKQFVSSRKANALALACFFIILGLISFRSNWWPDMMLAFGISLGLKNFLLRKYYSMVLTLFIFIGIYLSETIGSSYDYFLPVIFLTSGVFILLREYLEPNLIPEDQREEDLNHEIEEAQNKER